MHSEAGASWAASNFDSLTPWEESEDYRADAASFLAMLSSKPQSATSHSSGPGSEAQLPRVSLHEAQRRWKEMAAAGEPRRDLFAGQLFGSEAGLISGVAEAWSAERSWQLEPLRKRLANFSLQESTFGYPSWVSPVHRSTLAEYLDAGESRRNRFIYINEMTQGAPIFPTSAEAAALDALRADYMPLPAFAHPTEDHLAFLNLDGRGSGHSWHNHGPVWNTQVVGRKVWWLLPASVAADRDGYGAVPMVASFPGFDAEPYVEPNPCVMLRRRTAPPGSRMVIMRPGDTILLGDKHWHATCALDEHTVGIGGFLHHVAAPAAGPHPGVHALALNQVVAKLSPEGLVRTALASARPGDPDSVLDALDAFSWSAVKSNGESSFLMSIGDVKGRILDTAVSRQRPRLRLAAELGTFLGYSATRIARLLPPGAGFISVDPEDNFRAAASAMLAAAGLRDRVELFPGTADDFFRRLASEGRKLDLLFIDHIKSLYLPDLQSALSLGVLAEGCIVVADNVKWPGAPDYKAFITSSEDFNTTVYDTLVEYHESLQDQVTVSTYHSHGKV
jgi:catechol O-methyltransferase